jgi:hypothetical protein
MRLSTLSKLLVLGGAAALVYKHRSRHSFRTTNRAAAEEPECATCVGLDSVPDPGDPVQGFDEASELQVVDFDVDAVDRADAEAAQDLASLENEATELDTPSETTLDAIDESLHDVGELYGVHTPRAEDRNLLDDDEAFDCCGENWLEALDASSTEYGAVPEEELDVDDSEGPPEGPHRDTPVADRGSGGPAGV